MDIAMPREDFEQFLVCASKELTNNLELITFKNNKKYRYYLPRIINKKYEIIEKRYEKLNEKSNIFIDIFPIDGSPNNIFLRKEVIIYEKRKSRFSRNRFCWNEYGICNAKPRRSR